MPVLSAQFSRKERNMKRALEMIIRFSDASIGFDVPLTVESAFFFGRCYVSSRARGFQQPQE
jgi:hypothetical protein